MGIENFRQSPVRELLGGSIRSQAASGMELTGPNETTLSTGSVIWLLRNLSLRVFDGHSRLSKSLTLINLTIPVTF